MKDKKPEITTPTPSPKPEDPALPGGKNEIFPSFSYQDLEFKDLSKHNNRDRIVFFVHGEQPMFIETFLGEFLDYQRAYFEMFSALPEGDICRCDLVEPQYELMTYLPITAVNMVIKPGEEAIQKEHEEDVPFFFVFDLAESLKISIHPPEEHNNEKK